LRKGLPKTLSEYEIDLSIRLSYVKAHMYHSFTLANPEFDLTEDNETPEFILYWTPGFIGINVKNILTGSDLVPVFQKCELDFLCQNAPYIYELSTVKGGWRKRS